MVPRKDRKRTETHAERDGETRRDRELHRGQKRQRKRPRAERRARSRENQGETEGWAADRGSYRAAGCRDLSPQRLLLLPLEPGASGTAVGTSPAPRLPGSQEPQPGGQHGSPAGPPLCPARLSALSPKLSVSREERRLPSFLPSSWAGDPAWAPARRGVGEVWEVLTRGRLQARALHSQNRHPPREVRGNRCAFVVSMEIRQPGNLDGRWAWASKLLSSQRLSLSAHTESRSRPGVHRGRGFPPGCQVTPKQGQMLGGGLGELCLVKEGSALPLVFPLAGRKRAAASSGYRMKAPPGLAWNKVMKEQGWHVSNVSQKARRRGRGR